MSTYPAVTAEARKVKRDYFWDGMSREREKWYKGSDVGKWERGSDSNQGTGRKMNSERG